MKPESIRLKSLLWMTSLVMLAFAPWAQAKVACNFASNPGFTLAYVPSHPGSAIISTTFVVSCTDTGGNPAGMLVTYSVAANNGLTPSGIQNRAAFGGSFLNYSVTQDAACTIPWKGTTYFSASFTVPQNGTVNNTYTYYGCVPAGQNPSTGTYTDTVTTSFAVFTTSGGVTPLPGTFPVSIYTPATCTLSTPPGNINFSYTSLQLAAAVASTTFATTCTNTLPYTMALDATSGTIIGLNYTLAMSAASGTGTGLAQTYTINGTLAAGQLGTCAAATCTGSQIRTLTITY